MQDIDFDEIDRAVSSVRGRDTTPTPDVVAPRESIQAPDVESRETLSEAFSSSPAARRSTGRFMDVVHPSSDMRPNGGNDRSPAPAAASFHSEEVVSEKSETTNRSEPAAISSSAFHWPDPIEVAESAPIEEIPTPEPVLEQVTEPTSSPVPVTPLVEDDLDLIDDEDEEATPLESPFLSDAKVEKRPLGAFSTADSSLDLPLLEDFPAPTASLALAPAPEIEQETADVPAELHPDLLLLDTHSEDEEVPELLPEHTETVPENEIPTGPTSITQQYKEQPSTVSQPSGAIFDTEAYHQPLTHTPKKRSRAVIIVWIVALILVGGGIGAGIYFVVLPMLG